MEIDTNQAGTGNEDQTTPLDETIRHKTLLDTASILSCIPLFCFLPLNWFPNIERNRTFERNVWMATVWRPDACLPTMPYITTITPPTPIRITAEVTKQTKNRNWSSEEAFFTKE